MKFYKKRDIIIIAVILICSLAAVAVYHYAFADRPAKAEIYYGAQLVKTVDLNTGVDTTFSLEQNKHVVFHLYADGSICFEESDCPDKICVHTGRLRTVGQSAACLPNKFIVKIVSQKDRSAEDFDLIVGK